MSTLWTLFNLSWPLTADFKQSVTRMVGYDDFDGLQTLSDLSRRIRKQLVCGAVMLNGTMQQGVFASQDISCGQIVEVYLGRDIHVSHQRRDDINNDKIVSYGNRLVIPDTEIQSNFAHFINDSADGGFAIEQTLNVDFLMVPVTSTRYVILILSKRAINKGEELLLSYGSFYWETKNANGEAVYKPEHILDESDEKDAYLVQWQHFPNEKTWEPRSELQDCSVLDEWEMSKESMSVMSLVNE